MKKTALALATLALATAASAQTAASPNLSVSGQFRIGYKHDSTTNGVASDQSNGNIINFGITEALTSDLDAIGQFSAPFNERCRMDRYSHVCRHPQPA